MASATEKPSLNTLEPCREITLGNQRQALGDTVLAYVAGLVDGEGTIAIARQTFKDMRSPYYRIVLVVGMTNEPIIKKLNFWFPGSQYSTHNDDRGRNERKLMHRWSLWGPQAEKALRQIIPFLQVKKNQAALALGFQKTIVKCTARLNEKRKFMRIPPEEISKREIFYWKMRELNDTAKPTMRGKLIGRPRLCRPQVAAAETERDGTYG